MKSLLIFSILSLYSTAFSQDTVSVYFAFNSSTVTSTEAQKLTKIKDSEIRELSAFCDTVGTNDYNQRLAQRRLNAVLKLLKSTPKKKTLNGEEQASSASNYNAATSRRVDIIIDLPTVPAPETSAKTKGAIILATTFNEFIVSGDKKKTMDLSLLFIPGYPVLIKDSHPEIEELFQLLNDNPSIDAVIHGHVCCADDYKLSYDRALMVYQYLTKKGIAKERLEFMGHSNKDPRVSPETSEADRLANRRVTVDFIKK